MEQSASTCGSSAIVATLRRISIRLWRPDFAVFNLVDEFQARYFGKDEGDEKREHIKWWAPVVWNKLNVDASLNPPLGKAGVTGLIRNLKGVCKLNVDAALSHPLGEAGVRSLIRNMVGECKGGFFKTIPSIYPRNLELKNI